MRTPNNLNIYSLTGGMILGSLLLFAIITVDWIHIVFMGPLFIAYVFLFKKNALSKTVIFLFPILAILATMGSKSTFDYYHSVIWYNKLLHFMAAFTVTYFIDFIASSTALKEARKQKIVYLVAIMSVGITIGAFWEIFEWTFNLISPIDYYLEEGLNDAMGDLIIDTAGAVAAALVLYKSKD